ncbi:peroxiredoxin [Pontibacillus yanchengensis]|uniref:Peroxiredoxin n=3 Tax=Pontibacillus yanchengensis TaxID=462910 RepID=A0A0A2TVR9_9BACI|nr:peroxiredoxin [Pontibacillus yanchengensis]KGP73340.1 peroxiredoxin [Pontibacillus yanchengensis Y32]MYL35598.1 peroxiredoxin [Pontibacillus yanchengensis]MYL53658.1 peroxiredoxin [Pontibacillus yanchengensis]
METHTEEQKVNMPRIGDAAPQFSAATSQGNINLEDYKGKWVVLFSHPSDFTPVCTTEFVGFQDIYPELKQLNTELLGLSVDSVPSHIAWIRSIEENFDTKIEFPVIADLDKQVAMKYGMIMPGESQVETSRAVFVIDDKQKIRSIIYYPLTTGRNMQEILRLVKALQTTDEHGVSTPANWQEGDKAVVSPPKTQEEAAKRAQEEGIEYIDWYISKKDV